MEDIHLQVHSMASKKTLVSKNTQFVEFKKSDLYINMNKVTVSIHIHDCLHHRPVSKFLNEQQLRLHIDKKLMTY